MVKVNDFVTAADGRRGMVVAISADALTASVRWNGGGESDTAVDQLTVFRT